MSENFLAKQSINFETNEISFFANINFYKKYHILQKSTFIRNFIFSKSQAG
jgi:hypothetical protein